MIEVDLTLNLGQFHLDVAFGAPTGLTVLVGPSGSGKTALINAIAGVNHPARGRIRVDGTVLVDTALGIWIPAHRRRVGYIFQDSRLFPHLTVKQNLTYGRWFQTDATGAHSAPHVVDLLGIEHLLHRYPVDLSGGEKQRVAIGRALLANPRIILADEPLASLDDARKDEILPVFERLRDELKTPILYVTHATEEANRLATTKICLRRGKIYSTE